MKEYNIAVVGATGAVGTEMLKILEEFDLPIKNLKVIASPRSAGKKINFKDKEYVIESVQKGTFEDIDIALFSIGSGNSKKFAPQAVYEGALVIDNSNAYRMDDEVPLVVPEINSEAAREHNGIIANPNCSTIQMVIALNPLKKKFKINKVLVSTYQAVSGTGLKAIEELKEQSKAYLEGKDINPKVYPHQIAFNAIPLIDKVNDNGYTEEELKLNRESQKIFDDPELKVTATAVRIPVVYGHSESVHVELDNKVDLEEIQYLLSSDENIKLIDKPEDDQYPTPIMSEKDDKILVGRLRKDLHNENALEMWVVGNNIRKGAALNAVQIADHMIKSNLI
ncbi:MAG: aspartate-semialdehyde dehydrogenase [Halanaerobiales bacterium]|nr:aspartate-semialdehyde dehydrogenase [Halanaerobiales bacterium]